MFVRCWWPNRALNRQYLGKFCGNTEYSKRGHLVLALLFGHTDAHTCSDRASILLDCRPHAGTDIPLDIQYTKATRVSCNIPLHIQSSG